MCRRGTKGLIMMIKRLVLYSFLFCSIGSLLVAQEESASLHQTAVKKIRAFFKTKRGQALLAVGAVLLGVNIGWYLRGRSNRMHDQISFFGAAHRLWKQNFPVDVSVKWVWSTEESLLIITAKEKGLPKNLFNWYSEQSCNIYLKALRNELPTAYASGPITYIFCYQRDKRFIELDRCKV